jgi:hypothetical protein
LSTTIAVALENQKMYNIDNRMKRVDKGTKDKARKNKSKQKVRNS